MKESEVSYLELHRSLLEIADMVRGVEINDPAFVELLTELTNVVVTASEYIAELAIANKMLQSQLGGRDA